MLVSVSDLAQIVFVSALQRSDDPSPAQVRELVTARLGAGCDHAECLACVAQEAGDHPEEYASRMRWALAVTAAAFPEGAVAA